MAKKSVNSMNALAAAAVGAIFGVAATVLSKKSVRKKAISTAKELLDKSDKQLDKLQDKVIKKK